MEQQEATQGPTVSLVDGGISIDFSGHWNRNMTDYHFFSMSRKRNFATMAERSGTALATLLQDSDFAYGLLALRYGISLPEDDAQHISEESLPTAVAAGLWWLAVPDNLSPALLAWRESDCQ